MSERAYKFLFDKKEMKPGCVILQALYGGDSAPCHFFLDWQITPTPDMGFLTGTESQVKELAALCNRRSNDQTSR